MIPATRSNSPAGAWAVAPYPVTRTTGNSGLCFRISRAVSQPSISGIARSVNTRSKSSLVNLASASRPPLSVQFALPANQRLTALHQCSDGIYDQVHEHLAQFRGITQSQQSVFGIECNLDIQAGCARFILPTRARDFDCIAQQTAHVEQFK